MLWTTDRLPDKVFSDQVRGFLSALACNEKSCGNQHQPRRLGITETHERTMLLLCILWISLVLGGAAACLWYQGGLRDPWLRVARVPAQVCPPVWQQRSRGVFSPPPFGGAFLPPPRVATRSGPPPRPSAP